MRRLLPTDAPRARYTGFKQESVILRKGTVRREGAKPLSSDILFERDVPVTLRDGITIYTDVFRPVGDQRVPAVVAWSPYGKQVGGQWLDDLTNRSNVPLSHVSELQKFEAPDPAYWVSQGYAVVNPDVRGAVEASTPGRNRPMGRGNSIVRAAATSLGIGNLGFEEAIIITFSGNNYVEDSPRMYLNGTFYNKYWKNWTPQLSNITIPAYVVASNTNLVHTHGTFDGFHNILSKNKWLRVRNSHEWPDFYQQEHTEELRMFFDRYLNGSTNTVDRVVKDWPVPGLKSRPFFLHPNNSLAGKPAHRQGSVSYEIEANTTGVTFSYKVPELVEIIGYIRVRLWVGAKGSDDMELAIKVEKRDADDNAFPHLGSAESTEPVARGNIRVSRRALDMSRSTPAEPYLLHEREDLLSPGQIVPVDIGLWPTALRFHPGEQIVLTISPTTFSPSTLDMGLGVASAHVPSDNGTFAPGTSPALKLLGGTISNPEFVAAQRTKTSATRNNGTHVIHFGGKFGSYVLLPLNRTTT
ncbi:PepX-C domain-containing protein [Fusarium sp. Ph1]|nr:PepX-C domain-containing protein [Fusarium sp. Ph1]